MTIEDFEVLAIKRFQHCLSLMTGTKHKEYSRNNDKLHNFKVAGRIDNESPEKALWGMFKKHLVSIQDMVNDSNDPEWMGTLPSQERLSEKIGDSVNYLILLEGLITERIRNNE